MGSEANSVAYFAMTGLCFVPYLFMTVRRKWIGPALIGAAVVMLLALLYSLSRFAMLSLAVCAVYACLLWCSSLRLRATLLPLAAVGVLIWPLLPPNLSDRLMTISSIERIDSDSTIHLRIETIKAGVGMFMDSPIWGVGPGQFLPQYASEKYRYVSSRRRFVLHNAYVRALAEQGLLGLVPFLLLMGFSFHDLRAVRRFHASRDSPPRDPAECNPDRNRETAWKLRYQAGSFEIGLLATAITSLSQPSLYTKYMWLMFALSVVLYRLGYAEVIRRKPAPVRSSQEEEGPRLSRETFDGYRLSLPLTERNRYTYLYTGEE
jgi:hypothetical protein